MDYSDVAKTDKEWLTIQTTLPSVPIPNPPQISTDRLIIRPLLQSDLEAFHEMASQPEVAFWTMAGVPPSSIEVSRKKLQEGLDDHGTVNLAICLRETGKFIGTGGSHRREGNLGWPVMNYYFRSEEWRKGYATEFLVAFLGLWWTFPRSEATLKVDTSTVFGQNQIKKECITAVAIGDNVRSQRVMKQSGMQFAKVWDEDDFNKPNEKITLIAFEYREKVAIK